MAELILHAVNSFRYPDRGQDLRASSKVSRACLALHYNTWISSFFMKL